MLKHCYYLNNPISHCGKDNLTLYVPIWTRCITAPFPLHHDYTLFNKKHFISIINNFSIEM